MTGVLTALRKWSPSWNRLFLAFAHWDISEAIREFKYQMELTVSRPTHMHRKLAKLKGEFVWHHHEDEDELFLVVKGRLTIKLRDRDVALEEGEFCIIPRGVEHKPVAEQEAHILMFEPVGTLNTGNVQDERTVQEIERL